VRILVAQEAPTQGPAMLPASRLTTIDQCGAGTASGTLAQAGGQRGQDHGQAHGELGESVEDNASAAGTTSRDVSAVLAVAPEANLGPSPLRSGW
jgi:hypothetical protein